MQIEEYFDFLGPDDIRIRGRRIGIESILDEYIDRHRTVVQIQKRLPTLTLEQIYATLLYYHHNKQQMDAYMTEWIAHEQRMIAEQERNPPPGLQKLRERLQQQEQEQGEPAR